MAYIKIVTPDEQNEHLATHITVLRSMNGVRVKELPDGNIAFGFDELPQILMQQKHEWYEGNWDELQEKQEEPEPVVGQIPHGNIINMMFGKEFQNIDSYHHLVGWCSEVLGFGNHDVVGSEPAGAWKRDGFQPEFLAELDARVRKIDDISVLLTLIEMAEAGKRGCSGDHYNDDFAEAIKNACLTRLGEFDNLPPSLWHKVRRHQLWQAGAETSVVYLPSPDGFVSFNAVREAQHGGWKVRFVTPDGENHDSPQYVTKMGLKAKPTNPYQKAQSGVECLAYHLFNADGSLWGYEVYLLSPKKIVGCEVTKDGRFSLFRNFGTWFTLPADRSPDTIRQGDMLLKRIEVQEQDEIIATPLGDTPRELQSVTVHYAQVGRNYEYVKLTAGTREHKHPGYDYWHPVTRTHSDGGAGQPVEERVNEYKNEYAQVLILKEDAVLTHPDHPSIRVKAGYYQILPVEGETDYQPPQRRGD